eukprot:9413357-Alexandrium_andersonii.AAC.1
MRDGGFGLVSQELTAHDAHWASWWAAAGPVAARLGAGNIDALRAGVPALDTALSGLEAAVREAGWQRTALGDARPAFSQHDLTKVSTHSAVVGLRAELGHNSVHRVRVHDGA